jgi:predicted Zn-dependent protease
MKSRVFVRRASRAAAALVVAVGAACAINPATGKRQLVLIPEAQEIQMGKQAAEEVRGTLGLLDDSELQGYVARVGQQLAARSQRPELPWAFQVVDDPTPNAFALPGGFIYVTRGLLTLLTSEAELATVLGHEIAHVTARHSVNQISKQQLAQLGLGLGAILVPRVEQLTPVLGAGLNLLFLKYGRDDEREADALGFEYLRSGGYSLAEAADVFVALQRAGDDRRSALPSWLSTHPAPAERAEAAKARAAEAPRTDGGRVGDAAYLQRIDDLAYGENPRHGFFKDGVFYHPDLQFELTFPRGWQTDNLARAVVAVAPGRQAALQLTLAGTVGRDEALRRFLSQEGVEAGPATRVRTGSGPAAVAEFRGQTPEGIVQGLVAYVEHRGRTFQIVGYAPASRYPQFDTAFGRAIQSFATVTDPAILSVQPRRIDVLRVDRAQTLSQFRSRCGPPRLRALRS